MTINNIYSGVWGEKSGSMGLRIFQRKIAGPGLCPTGLKGQLQLPLPAVRMVTIVLTRELKSV